MRIGTGVLCLVFLASSALAQITITSTDAQAMYAAGKSWRMLGAQNLSITMNIGSASSAAQSWTVPTVVYTDTMRMDNLAPSATPYASLYPRATHARRMVYSMSGTTSTGYDYVRITADSVISLGGATRVQGSGMDTTYYDYTVALQVLFPLTYGRVITRRDSIPIAPGSYIIGRVTETYDAFGTLVVPGGSFQALRNKTVSISETYFVGQLYSRDTSTSLGWLSKEGVMVDIGPKDRNPGSGSISIRTIDYSYIGSSTGIADNGTIPLEGSLCQNYPNPFNPSTTIRFDLAKPNYVTLIVFDALGKEVAVLVRGERSSGTHIVRWSGEGYPSGIYFYRLTAGGHVQTGKMSLVR